MFEWCLDDYGPQPAVKLDPVVLGKGQNKVARGGDDGYYERPTSAKIAIEDEAELTRYVRSASRARVSPGIPYPIVGFRPVLGPAIEIPRPHIPDTLLIEPMATTD